MQSVFHDHFQKYLSLLFLKFMKYEVIRSNGFEYGKIFESTAATPWPNNEHISPFDFVHLISMSKWAEILYAQLLCFYNFAILRRQYQSPSPYQSVCNIYSYKKKYSKKEKGINNNIT